jgi:lipopolysaccharide transport system ATP-binding protein
MSGVSKVYPRVHRPRERWHAFTSLLLGREPREGVEVLKGVDLEVKRGQSLGIIGENGAGKSTLLKILTGVIRPSRGEVAVNGTIAALLELGAGFQPDFTGLENVRMNAALLGMSARELDEKLDGILAFADIGDYIHEPVKHYSSGMVVRLGFAVMAASHPDLLITDEVLAVGDESFQKKCISWIDDYIDGGGTLLFVSHSMFLVQKLCRHALWLHEGGIAGYGDVHRVAQDYLAWHESRQRKESAALRRAGEGGGHYSVVEVELAGHDGQRRAFVMGEDLEAELVLHSPDGREPVAVVGLVRADGTPVFGISSEKGGGGERVKPELLPPEPGEEQLSARRYRFRIRFPRLSLLPGRYVFRGHCMDPEGIRLTDTLEREFRVDGESLQVGLVRLECDWLEPVDAIREAEHDPLIPDVRSGD